MKGLEAGPERFQMCRLLIVLCLLASAQAGFLFKGQRRSGGGLIGSLTQGIVGFGGRILRNDNDNQQQIKPYQSQQSNTEQEKKAEQASPPVYNNGPKITIIQEQSAKASAHGPRKQVGSESNLEDLKAEVQDKATSNADMENYNRTNAKKAKVKSSQSIRIIIPGKKKEPAPGETYTRKSASIGQGMSKHLSEEDSASLAVQGGGRVNSASIARERTSGVDASQRAHVIADSNGGTEILLTQDSLAQSGRRVTETRGSAATSDRGTAVHAASSSSRSRSSGRSQDTNLSEESYTRWG